ncbi:MAG: type II toxin-antitoxin system prevent-host-death family antitoxin [Pseudomonadales bacterium]|nr:type II toxin-antitoxin system prevent-host-death family antitoxin [Pseudomonadales bacterium]
MQTINISEFRANLLKYLEIVHAGEQISVTSNGKPLATIAPPVNQQDLAKEQLKFLASTARIHDVVSPTENNWDSMA